MSPEDVSNMPKVQVLRPGRQVFALSEEGTAVLDATTFIGNVVLKIREPKFGNEELKQMMEKLPWSNYVLKPEVVEGVLDVQAELSEEGKSSVYATTEELGKIRQLFEEIGLIGKKDSETSSE